jgi:hypothetical protein
VPLKRLLVYSDDPHWRVAQLRRRPEPLIRIEHDHSKGLKRRRLKIKDRRTREQERRHKDHIQTRLCGALGRQFNRVTRHLPQAHSTAVSLVVTGALVAPIHLLAGRVAVEGRNGPAYGVEAKRFWPAVSAPHPRSVSNLRWQSRVQTRPKALARLPQWRRRDEQPRPPRRGRRKCRNTRHHKGASRVALNWAHSKPSLRQSAPLPGSSGKSLSTASCSPFWKRMPTGRISISPCAAWAAANFLASRLGQHKAARARRRSFAISVVGNFRWLSASIVARRCRCRWR